MLVRIIRFSRTVKSRVFTRTFTASISGSIAIRCVTATYRARVDARVRLRDGRVLTGTVVTRRVHVVC